MWDRMVRGLTAGTYTTFVDSALPVPGRTASNQDSNKLAYLSVDVNSTSSTSMIGNPYMFGRSGVTWGTPAALSNTAVTAAVRLLVYEFLNSLPEYTSQEALAYSGEVLVSFRSRADTRGRRFLAGQGNDTLGPWAIPAGITVSATSTTYALATGSLGISSIFIKHKNGDPIGFTLASTSGNTYDTTPDFAFSRGRFSSRSRTFMANLFGVDLSWATIMGNYSTTGTTNIRGVTYRYQTTAPLTGITLAGNPSCFDGETLITRNRMAAYFRAAVSQTAIDQTALYYTDSLFSSSSFGGTRTTTALWRVTGISAVTASMRSLRNSLSVTRRIDRIVLRSLAGEVRYFKFRDLAGAGGSLARAYREASATEILNELEPLPTATAGTFSVATKSLSLTSSGSGTFDLEAASGGRGTITYSLVSPPSGITISGRRVTVAGSVAASASISLTARATWSLNNTTATTDSTFTLAVARTQAPSAGSFSVSAKTVAPTHDGSATFMLDAATGGTGNITYSLVSPPSGITISGRTVTVAASVPRNPSVSLTARATWTTPEGTRSVNSTFNLNVNRAFPPAAVGTFTPGNQVITMPASGSGTVQFAAATGGTGTITYALRGTVPTGITLSGRTLSVQQVVTDGPKALTVRATWTSGTSTAMLDRSFTLLVRRPLRYLDQSASVSHGETFILPTATLGTAPYTYSLGAEQEGSPATSWGTEVTHDISVTSVLEGYNRPLSLATDPVTGTIYMAVKTATNTFTLYTLDEDNNFAVTSVGTITGMHSRYSDGRLAISFTPAGKLYALRVPFSDGNRAGTLAVYELNKTTGAVSSTVNSGFALTDPRYSSFNMFSETQAYVSVYGNNGVSILTVATGAVVNATVGTGQVRLILASGINPNHVNGVTLYNNKLFYSEFLGRGDISWRDLTSGSSTRLQPRKTYEPYGITFYGRNYIVIERVSSSLMRVHANPATSGSDYEPFVADNLPTGITFNTATRALSVTSAAPTGLQRMVLRVRDALTPTPETVFADVDITVVAIPMPDLPAINDIEFRDGEGDTTHTLPEATSGVGAKTYTLTLQDGSALPAEISFNSTTRVMTLHDNNIDIGDGTFNLRYTATDANSNSDHKDFSVTVLEPYAVAGSLSISDSTLNLSSTAAGTLSIEAATGGLGDLEYVLLSPPAGFSMPNPTNRVLRVAGSVAAGEYDITVQAQWESGGRTATANSTFKVTITRTLAPAVGTFSQTAKSINVTSSEVENVALSAASGGTGTITYSLVSPPTGITLSATTLTVANTVLTGRYNITVRATWTTVEGALSSTASFVLTVTRSLAPVAGTFTQSDRRLSLRLTNAGSLSIDTASGGVGTVTYALVSPPTGVSLSDTTLSVAATYQAQVQNITVVATWTTAEGSATRTATFELTVTRSAAPAVVGTFSPTNKTLSLSSSASGTFTVEAASGGTGTISYSLVSPPAGITMSGRVVTVAGNAAASNNIAITVRATWTLGSETATLDRTITLTLNRTLAPQAGTFSVGTQTLRATWNGGATATLPAATGGTGSVNYTLVTPPSGITLAANRVLTLSNTLPAGNYSVTARATWTTVEGSAQTDANFTVAFTRAPRPAEAGTFNVGNRTFNFSHTEAGTFEIPAAVGGVGELSYGLISAPAGITISGRVVTIAGTVPAGIYNLRARALWFVSDPLGPDSSVFRDSSFTLTLTRPPVASAGTFRVGTKVVDLAPDAPGVVELDAATGGVGTISYALVSAPTGVTLQGRFLTVAATVPASSGSVVVKAIWTSGPTTAEAEATFLLTVNRVGGALVRQPVRLTQVLQRVRLRLERRGSKVVVKENTLSLTEFASATAAASFDVSDMVIYKERLRLYYQYVDASGIALNPEPIDIPDSDWELVEDDVLLSIEGQNLIYDNRLQSATQIRLTFDSSLRPDPVRGDAVPNLTADALQEELTKRDLQDAYILRSGSVDPGTVHGDNIVDGSIRGSKLATNSLSSDALAQGSVTTAKLADGSVTATKVSRGLLYTPGVSDPNNLSTLDLTEQADGSVVGDWVFITNNNRAKKLTRQNYLDDTGTPVPENQLGRYAVGLVRTVVGADVRIATVDGAIVTGLSGLSTGQAYSLADDGSLQAWEQGHYQVGVALSSTRLMIRRG